MIENKKIAAVCIARIQDDASNEYITALNKLVSREGYGIFVYNPIFDSYNNKKQP